MDIQFTSNQNKGMIWKLLCDNGTFNSIPESKANLVKIDFDRKIALISTTMTDADQLVTLNKRVIGEMVQSVSKFQNTTTNENTLLPNYNAADISQQRQKVFENELKQKQNDFEKFNSKPVPTKIDFADKMDVPLGSEMDKILAEQIAMREKQLNMVLGTQDKTAASKWLQNSQVQVQNSQVQNSQVQNSQVQVQNSQVQVQNSQVQKTMPTANDNIQLKIGEDIKIGEKELINSSRKKVNFIEPININDDFMSLLKKKPVEERDTLENDITIKEMLTNIMNKQNQILDLLTNKYIL